MLLFVLLFCGARSETNNIPGDVADCKSIQCSAIHRPVCGTNCVQYYNQCALDAANCRLGANYTVRNSGLCSAIAEPEILEGPQHVEVTEGSAFSLHCSVTGHDVSVRWVHNGELLDYSHKYEGHSLIVDGSTIWDAGQYYCEIWTCAGTKQIPSSEATVIVSPRSGSLAGPVCTLLGIGHALTFDSYGYKLKRQCSYNLMTDCERGGWFIYGMYAQCPGGICLDNVEIIRDKDTILLSRAWEVRVNEVLHPMSIGDPLYARNAIIRFTGRLVTVEVPGEYLIEWDGLHGLSIILGQSMVGKVCGMCGNGDSKGYTSNELTGFIYNPKRQALDFNDFKEQWVVDKSCPDVEVPKPRNCEGRYSRTCAKIFRQLFKGCSYFTEAHFFLTACNEFACLENNKPGGGVDGFSVECQVGEAMARWCSSHGGNPGPWWKKSRCPDECGIRQAVIESSDCDCSNNEQLLDGCS